MRSIIVQIPQPCHEHWNDMLPDARGRFCARCQKSVVDYSLLSDQDIIKQLSQSSGTICGRLSDDQLNRPLVPLRSPSVSLWSNWVSLLTFSLLSWQSAWAQRHSTDQSTQPRTTQQPITRTANLINSIGPRVTNKSGQNWIISGRIMAADSNSILAPIPNIDVYVNGVSPFQPYERYQAKTDSLGAFTITVPMQEQNTCLKLWPFVDKFILKTIQIDASPRSTYLFAGDIIIRQAPSTKSLIGGGLRIVKAPTLWEKVKRKLFR